jgi:hypothetical protein
LKVQFLRALHFFCYGPAPGGDFSFSNRVANGRTSRFIRRMAISILNFTSGLVGHGAGTINASQRIFPVPSRVKAGGTLAF